MVFVSPHNDDETLFGTFTLLAVKPTVVIVYDGFTQAARGAQITAQQRRAETLAAMEVLSIADVRFMGLRDDEPADPRHIRAYVEAIEDDGIVFAPLAELRGHQQHNLVAGAFEAKPRVMSYSTYTTAGKSTRGAKVPWYPEWALLKLRALACYRSQMLHPVGCAEHFMRDQTEYMQV